MELHQIRYFLALCRELNFTRAAEVCHVSQPALTKAIKSLEGEFGGTLFQRERNNTHLTALGQIMKPHKIRPMDLKNPPRQRLSWALCVRSAPMATLLYLPMVQFLAIVSIRPRILQT